MPLSDYKMKFVIDADGRTARQELDSVYTKLNMVGGSATAAFGGAIPVASAASVAFLATAAAVVKVGSALYDITKTAAEYGSTIYDATQKTGLGATAISSLKVAADQSGASLEAVTKGIAKFAKGYKGESEDLQTALGDVMKQIAEAKPGFEQLTLAQKHFGKAGADLIPVIRSFDGDLPGLIKHMDELGVTIDDKAARAADEFGDQMDMLSTQVAGVGRTIGTELMPHFTQMANTVSGWLVQNKGEIADYASRLGTLFGNIIRGFNSVKNWIIENQTYLRIAAGVITFGGSEAAINGASNLGKFLDTVSTAKPTYGTESSSKAYRGFDMDEPGGGKGTGKIRRPPKETDSEFRQFFDELGFNVVRTFGKALNEGSPHTKGGAADISIRGKSMSDIFTLMVKSLEKGYRVFDERVPQPGVKQTGPHVHVENAKTSLTKASVFASKGFTPDQIAYLKELDRQRLGKSSGMSGFESFTEKSAADIQKAAEEDVANAQKSFDEWLAAEEKAMGYRLDMRRSEANLAEEILREQLNTGLIDEMEYADRVGQLKIDMLQDERDEVAEQIPDRENLERLARLDLEIATARLKKENDITEALRDQAEEREKAIKDLKKANQRPSRLKKRGEARGGFGAGLLDAMGGERFESQADALASVYQRLGNVAGQAIGGLANAMGSLVENWVLYGSASEGGARKAIASALAMAAAQSTVSAIMETAYGIAALTPWGAAIYGPAPLHFKSAALFGLVAAGTALGGRAIAGDSFKSEKSGGRSSSSGTGSSQRSPDPNNPYSRVSSGAYDSGRRNDPNIRLATAVEDFTRKFGAVKSGDVLMAGMRQKPGAVGQQVVSDVKRNARTGRDLLSATGVR